MMIFLTLVFIASQLVVLVKGKVFYDELVLIGEYELAKKTGDSTYSQQDKAATAAIKVLLGAIPMLIVNISYLIYAVNIDPYKLPTIIILAYVTLSMVLTFCKKKNKLETEEDIQKYKSKLYEKGTVSGFIRNLIWLGYYSYIFYVLVFVL